MLRFPSLDGFFGIRDRLCPCMPSYDGERRAGPVTRLPSWRPGRDRRAVRHPGATGRLHAPAHSSTIVVGGGIAGLAAATGLAERGVRVTLLEREPQLGGRVRAWPLHAVPDRPSSEPPVDLTSAIPGRTMSRGFHAFFRQYYNLRALLRRADPALERLRPIADYPLISAGGLSDSFAQIPRTPPLSFISFVAQSPSFTARDLARVDVAAALELLAVSFPDTFGSYDGESAADFLDRLRFPPAARHLALEVFARSFFAHPSEFSAGELVAMFHTYFLGSAEGLLFDVPVDDYDTALWAPLGRYLHALGVETRTGVSVEQLSIDDDGATVQLDDGTSVEADACVLAADPATTRFLGTRCRFVTDIGDEAAANWRERLAATRIAPPFAVWRFWLNRPVRSDRPAFLGTSGFGPLDNVSVLERFEAGAAGWHRETGGSVVEVHAYALSPELGGDHATQKQTKEQLRAELSRVYPETADARIMAEEWLVRDDCPLVGTGPWHLRPGVETPAPRLVLAGDGVRCDFPVALMERAATTGFQAANALLGQWGTAGHDLWTVPMAGRRPLGRVAAALAR